MLSPHSTISILNLLMVRMLLVQLIRLLRLTLRSITYLVLARGKSLESFALHPKVDHFLRGYFNNITYIFPKVPTLYTVLTVGKDAVNPVVYGIDVNPFVFRQGEIIEIVVNNGDTGGHPFHLHGHQFQVLARSDENQQPWDGHDTGLQQVPVRRDTMMVKRGGYMVLRFKANNLG